MFTTRKYKNQPRKHVKAVALRSGKELQPEVQVEESQVTEPAKEQAALNEKGRHLEKLIEEKSSPQAILGYKPNVPYPARLKKDSVR